MKSAAILLPILAIVASHSLEFEDCQQVQNKTQEECTSLVPQCLDLFGIVVSWTEDENNQGFCQQRLQNCGYTTAWPCENDPQCAWDKTEMACYTVNTEMVGDSAEDQTSAVVISDEVAASIQTNGISYVAMPNPRIPSRVALSVDGLHVQDTLLHKVAISMCSFYDRMSRGKIKMFPFVGLGKSPPGNFADRARLFYLPGASSRVPIIGNAASAKHELGHQLGLGHAQVRIWADQTHLLKQKNESDPFDPMTTQPDVPSMNAPHIHFKGWFTATEEAYAKVGGQYVLNLINAASTDKTSLKALFYQVPGTQRMIWFSYVRVTNGKASILTAPTDMPGTAIAVHSNDNSNSVGVMTYLEGLLGQKPVTNIRCGLIIQVINPTPSTVTIKVSMDPNWVLMGH